VLCCVVDSWRGVRVPDDSYSWMETARTLLVGNRGGRVAVVGVGVRILVGGGRACNDKSEVSSGNVHTGGIIRENAY
jgi:hypothetical protein